MKLLAAFFQLVRWPNLFFVALTQCLYYGCLFNAVAPTYSLKADLWMFFLLVLASVLIAAAGYIINDYFDQQIDKINKPQKVIVGKIIHRRWVILWHWVLSVAGIGISFYISYKTGKWILGWANLAASLLLWFYSTTFKKRLLIGNIIIAALSAWVILVVYFFVGAGFNQWYQGESFINFQRFFKFTTVYTGFAFVTSLIREAIKDLEDMEGDRQYLCHTMPIVWGVPASKVYVGVWLIVCMGALGILQLYAWHSGMWVMVLFIAVFLLVPLISILRGLLKAVTAVEYHRLSTFIKLVMLAGILSMLFFLLYLYPL